jgi:hypothetical protein
VADLTIGPPSLDHDRRGQVLLVTGFALAVTFVGLALVFNSVIYTENLATRSESTTTTDPLVHKQSVASGTATLIEYVNEYNGTTADDYDDLKDNFTWAFDNVTTLMVNHQLNDGQVVEDDIVRIDEGTRVVQTNQTRNFTSFDDNESSWTVLDDAEDVRSFEIFVDTKSSLADNENPDSIESLLSTDGEPFNMTVTDGIDEWRLNVSEDSLSRDLSPDPYFVGWYSTATGESGVCGFSSLPVVINVSDGTINGTECPGLEFGEGFSTVPDIEYNNGHNINGSYEFVANKSYTNVDSAVDDNYGPNERFPRVHRAIYGARIEVDYESDALRYTSDFQVIPDETHD